MIGMVIARCIKRAKAESYAKKMPTLFPKLA